MSDYFDRTLPLVPKGAIELQTHGPGIRFRNIYIREISAAEAKATHEKPDAKLGRLKTLQTPELNGIIRSQRPRGPVGAG